MKPSKEMEKMARELEDTLAILNTKEAVQYVIGLVQEAEQRGFQAGVKHNVSEAVKIEREECAKVADQEFQNRMDNKLPGMARTANEIAKAIRSRGSKEKGRGR